MERIMKLCAIYNVWGDYDLLEHSVSNILPFVDCVVVIYSIKSNYGETFDTDAHESFCYKNYSLKRNVQSHPREPQFSHPMNSETDKRNYGLKIAREQGYTHFLMMDADEFWNPIDFQKAKDRFHVEPDLQGLVCQTQVFFKKPTLTIGLDTTLVPFIHKLTPTIKHEFNKRYPFAWQGHQIKIDPTRSLNIDSGVKMDEAVMFHMSWVRKDYAKKIRNSTARANIEKSTIMQDLLLAKEGYFVKFYGKVLHAVPNYFNLPEYDVLV